MRDHFDIIKSLTKEEFAKLGLFLNSPILNTSVRLINYYNFLKRNYRKYSKQGLSKDDIKSKFFKAKTLSDEQKAEINYRKLISDFNKKLFAFMVFIESEHKINQKLLLMRAFRKRNLNRNFNDLSEELEDYFLNKAKMDAGDYGEHKKFLEEVRLYTFSTDYHSAGTVVQNESNALDLLFISEKLGAFQNMFSLEYVNKETKYNWSFYDEISNFIEGRIEMIKKTEPCIYFNYMVLKLAKNTSEKSSYTKLKKFLNERVKNIEPIRLKRFTFDLINYCYLQVNEGNSSFRKEIHSLLTFLDENNLLVADGNINHSYFKAAVDNAVSLRELNWLSFFIEKYSNYLEPEYQDSLFNLANTKLYLYRGEYDKARFCENKINYKDYIHYIDAKLTLACIEYESGNIESVLSVFDSVKKYLIKNTHISDFYNFFYKNFINLTTRLIKLNEKKVVGKDIQFELDKVEKSVEKENRPFYGKLWLQNKISLLK